MAIGTMSLLPANTRNRRSYFFAGPKGAGFVGSSYSYVMSTSGRLFLGFNDYVNYFFDNSGSFRVTIDLSSAVPENHTLVTNTQDSGPGSLRNAITCANSHPGRDTISFAVSGTINLASPLPPITDPVVIDGDTAPGYSGQPLIELNGASAG